MTRTGSKVLSLAAAVSLIRDGDVVALGGEGDNGRPMALVREIIRQGRRNLHLVGIHGGLDVELLVAAGCVTKLEMSSIVARAGGTPPNVARVLDNGLVAWTRVPDALARERFLAAALKRPFLPSLVSRQDGSPLHPCQREITCPFTQEVMLATKALAPDIALIHARASDSAGNVQLGAFRSDNPGSDLDIARAARILIVSIEQLVSEEAATVKSSNSVLAANDVTHVVELPFGAHPYGFEPCYVADKKRIEATCEEASFQNSTGIDTDANAGAHEAYLNGVGAADLFAISRNRLIRP